MNARLLGLHHVTAIASDPNANVAFYTGLLGLRLVKRTVNFDDPGSYHLYYGDDLGRPGTIMTFFLWPGAPRGRQGTGQATTTAFAIPPDALAYWRDRLRQHDVATEEMTRFGETVLAFHDPDGMKLELIAPPTAPGGQGWTGAGVPAEVAIRGFRGVTLELTDAARTDALLTDTMGYRLAGEADNRRRYVIGEDGANAPGQTLDIVVAPAGARGAMGAGVVHHIAFRTPDDPQQEHWLHDLSRLGYSVSPVMDRSYFHSIYYRTPGQVLFEIATDVPGFATDETPETLGAALKLPPQYEGSRAEIERSLPPLPTPQAAP